MPSLNNPQCKSYLRIPYFVIDSSLFKFVNFVPDVSMMVKIIYPEGPIGIGEKFGLSCLYYYDVKYISPVIANKVLHAFVPLKPTYIREY